MKFYFTYGSSGMAYEGGWTEVEAPSRATAMQAFFRFPPPRQRHDGLPGHLHRGGIPQDRDAGWRQLRR